MSCADEAREVAEALGPLVMVSSSATAGVETGRGFLLFLVNRDDLRAKTPGGDERSGISDCGMCTTRCKSGLRGNLGCTSAVE